MKLVYEITLDPAEWKGREDQLRQALTNTGFALQGAFSGEFWSRHGFTPSYELDTRIEHESDRG